MPVTMDCPKNISAYEHEALELDAKDRLILALDYNNAGAALDMVDQLDGVVSFFKVGLELFISSGYKVVDELIKRGKRVFFDLKLNDIDETITKAVRVVSEKKVTFLTIHGNGATARAAKEGRGDSEYPKIFHVTLLTSLDEHDLRDLGIKKSIEDYIREKAESALNSGCDGLICSGREVRVLREGFEARNPLPILICPGIRMPEGSDDDHKRPSTPYDAISNGANYLVVGRPIRNAANPRDAANRFIEEIGRASQIVG